MNKPLEGIKILELTHVIAAPFCGMLLGDLGAEIIKVEKPGEGEYGRIAGPRHPDGTSLWYPNYNRNKKGITVDLKQIKGIEIIKNLVKESDIFLENFRPGLLAEMGLGYEDIKSINPNIIMVSLSGYGQEGPYAMKTAFDMTIMAIGGLMGITGEADGIPMKMGTAVSDFVAGLYGVIGTLAALRHRDLTGEGQYVDVSMLDGVLSILETSIAEFDHKGKEPPRPGNRRVYTAPSNVFKAKDGYIYIAAFFQNHWRKICQLMDREYLVDHEKFVSGNLRKQNEGEVEAIISDWCKHKTVDEIESLLEENGIPCAPVNSIERVINDKHIQQRKSIISFDYPGVGEFRVAGFPVKFSKIDTSLNFRANTLGEHNDEIICGMLGYSKEEYEELQKKGVI